MINELISVGSLIAGTFSYVSGIKQAKRLDDLERIISKLDVDVQKLSDSVLYMPTFRDIQDINRLNQQTVRDNDKIQQVLIETQRTLGGVLLSSAIIPTPYKMQHALSHDPREVLLDVQPLASRNFGALREGLVPILFPYDGIYYLGWQLPGVLPFLFDFIYTPNAQTFVDQKVERELSREFNFGKVTEMIVDASGADISIEKTSEPNCTISLYGDSEQLHNVDIRNDGHRLNLNVTVPSKGNSESIITNQGRPATKHNSKNLNVVHNSIVINGFGNIVLTPESLIRVKIRTGDLSRLELTSSLHTLAHANVDIDYALISMMGSGEVCLTTASRFLGRIMGSGDIIADRVESVADLFVSGSGDIHIYSGQLDHLLAELSGSGSIIANVQTKDAVARLTGSGKISIQRVLGVLQQLKTGSGSIYVGTYQSDAS